MSNGYIASASFAQRQLRYLDLLQPGRSDYAVPLILEISGNVDEAALRQAFQAVIDRHDVLRTSLPLIDDTPMQAVPDARPIALQTLDVSPLSPAQWQQNLKDIASEIVAQPLGLEHGPLIAATLVRPDDPGMAGCAMALAVVFHHAIADGGSLPIFLDDLVVAYNAALSGTAPLWPELALQYADYADWEQERYAAPDAPALAPALQYWRDTLRDAPALLALPVDYQRPLLPAPALGATAQLTLPSSLCQHLSDVARAQGATPFLAFLTAFFAVLQRWSGLDDLIVTVPVSKRTRPELTPLIGLLVDTLPLRVSCEPDLSFNRLLENVQRAFQGAVRYRDVPFQRIVQSVDIERRTDVIPLMQILFGTLESVGETLQAADGVRYAVLDSEVEQDAKTDLSFVYRTTDQGVELWCRYNPALFHRASIENLLSWFGALATAAALAPDRPIADLALINEAQGRDLIARFNSGRTLYPRDQSLVALFDETASRYPERIAVQSDGRLTSYAALAAQVKRLAGALTDAGLAADDPVVLTIPLSDRFITLVLAIVRIGAVYVPLDPAQPAAHRARLAGSVGARAVITASGEALGDTAIETLSADELFGQADITQTTVSDTVCTATQAAYIMFTSGSTGEPKGVAIGHRAIVRLVKNTNFASFGTDTRAAVYSNPSFDASTLELWAPLLNGGTAVIVPREDILNAQQLRRALDEHSITLLWITAGLFQEIASIDPSVFSGDRLVMTGGDIVDPNAARAVLAAGAASGLRLLNGYGPTENTTFSTFFDLADLQPDSLSVPIGRPIAHSTVYILDRSGQPLPAGIIGEIYVGGDGVACGYVGDPGRTSAAFSPDPFSTRDDARMYRTGDYGAWRADGCIHFSGRKDDQIKLRGFRIELNEIATALGRHPSLRTVHVSMTPQGEAQRRILAYIVAHTSPPPTAAEMRQFLEPQLPSHMLPSAYIPVPALVLNINGKVDRKQLPMVQDHHYDRSEQTMPPRSDEEHALHAIWLELLDLDSVGITDNFFHIGGDSILAIRMAARASEDGLTLTPSEVFQLQTIERLAAAACAARPAPRRIASDRIFPAELVPVATFEGAAQPFLLGSLIMERPVQVMELAVCVSRLAEMHDALRLRWRRDGGSSGLEIMAYVARLPIRTIEAPGLADADLNDWIAAHAMRIGRGLDTQTGVTIATTLVDRGATTGPVAILAVHRAVADELTLMLLVTQLQSMISGGHLIPAVSDRTTTYGEWLEWLEVYANAQAAGSGLALLESPIMQTAVAPAFPDHSANRGQLTAQRWLEPTTAAALFDSALPQLGVTLLDMLATSLAATLTGVSSDQGTLIEAIDSQRLMPPEAPDVSRLSGNLDNVLIIMAPTGAMPLDERLRTVKSARQSVSPTAPVYRALGQTFDLPAAALGLAWTRASPHDAIGYHSQPTFSASVKGALIVTTYGSGRARLDWAGAEPEGSATALLDSIAKTLAQIVGLAQTASRPLYTRADFPLARLSEHELDRLIDTAADIQDIYPLSPMQEAMLIHTLGTTHSQVNFEQSAMRIRGHLDLDALRHAWATVIERHDVLRTSFHWRGLARPLQVVHQNIPLPLTIQNWDGLDPNRLNAFLSADRAQGFELEQAPLLRLNLIQTAPDDIHVIASFHHLLIDGWCLGRLEREVRAAYETYQARPPLFDPPIPYRSYIAWLAQADYGPGQRFFADLLRDLPDERRLYPAANTPPHAFAAARHTLSRSGSRTLLAFARRRGLTLATTIHFAWAVWLSARLGCDDVVFGTTVSGRPAGIAGVEKIIGLFINNLPVRLKLKPTTTPAQGLESMQALLGQLQTHAHLPGAMVADAANAGRHSGALFDTLVVVENLDSGTSAWSGALGLTVESVHSRLKTAYDTTLIAIPGDAIVLSLIQPEDERNLNDGQQVLESLAAILEALPEAADQCIEALPLPPSQAPASGVHATTRQALRFSTRPRNTLEARIADTIADLATMPVDQHKPAPIADLDTDFWRLGMNSLELIRLAARLEQALGRSVPIALLLEHRSVAALARAIESGQIWSPVVPMSNPAATSNNTPPSPPFICVHPVAGDVSVFLDLARAMPASIPFWAIQAAGLEEGQQPLESVEALAQANLLALAARGDPHPRRLGGYSFGGLVAFEMACQLARDGHPPEHVIIIDTPAPLERISILDPDPDRAHAQWLVRMAEVRTRFQGVQPALSFDEVLSLPADQRFECAVQRLHASGLLPLSANAKWLERAHRTSLVQYGAYLAYQPTTEHAPNLPLSLIRALAPSQSDLGELENRQLAIPDMGWQVFTTLPIRVLGVAGDHVTILGADTATDVAHAIVSLLNPEI